MKVKKICISLWILVLLSVGAQANNVKIVGDVKVVANQIQGGIAPIEFTLTWDNSWRDQFNHDAVYVFLKYKINNGSNTWQHVLLTGDVELPSGFGSTMVSSRNNIDKSEGVLIYRNAVGDGSSSVKLKLHWDINSNGLNSDPFVDGQVFLSAMAIETVYVPQGAFRAGDPSSAKAFRNKYQGIPAKYDVLNSNLTITVRDNVVNAANPPVFALNRINDITNGTSNAWVGTSDPNQYFQIDFGKNTKVQYVAFESMPGYAPKAWTLLGLTSDTDSGLELLSGTDKDWSTSLVRTYPTTKRLKLAKNIAAYRYYRLKVGALGDNGVAIKNISMATEDLDNVMDNSALICSPTIAMDTNNGYTTNYIYSSDGEITKGEVQGNYPTGYNGFYAMKYEISQEQYVAFLNKLALTQQAARTIGSALTSLREGQYVFSDDHENPQNRNGIILASRTNATAPLVFANNLKKDTDYSQDGDGQTLACNYLTPADMRAYADWCGLRPLTELEYEKMSRRPFPEVPLRGEYAWNSVKYTLPGANDFTTGTEGKKNETLNSGNVNAGGKISGPVRVGAFAKNAGGQENSGISFWGIADLSGNLAEIYYNLDNEGRRFCGNLSAYHGNGEISDYGDSDMNDNVWPLHHNAFTWRGGSFKTSVDNMKELATSDRSHNKGNYTNMEINVRYPDVTFRLGCSKAVVSANSVLTLQNGLPTSVENAADTVCSGSDYLIRGDIPSGITGAYSVAWLVSGNSGKTWDLLEGESGKDLRISNLQNINTEDGYFKEYQYKRLIFGYNQNIDAVSGVATIRVVNFNIRLTPDTSAINVFNTSTPIQLVSKLPVKASWSYQNGKSDTLMYQITAGTNFIHYLRFTDLYIGGVAPDKGVKPLVINWEFYGKYCAAHDTVWVKVPEQPGIAASPEAVVCGQSFRDNRTTPARLYHTVKVGNACWMAENMNYSEAGIGKCYNDVPANCEAYGRLYSWTEAQSVCPSGWHLPNINEWNQLNTELNARGMKASTDEWKFKGGANDMGLNTVGFNGLPAGGYFTYAVIGVPTEGKVNSRTTGFYDQAESNGKGGVRAWWWTSTSVNHDYVKTPAAGDVNMPYYVMLDFENNYNAVSGATGGFATSIFCGTSKTPFNTSGTALENILKNQFYMSVRCVKDAVPSN